MSQTWRGIIETVVRRAPGGELVNPQSEERQSWQIPNISILWSVME